MPGSVRFLFERRRACWISQREPRNRHTTQDRVRRRSAPFSRKTISSPGSSAFFHSGGCRPPFRSPFFAARSRFRISRLFLSLFRKNGLRMSFLLLFRIKSIPALAMCKPMNIIRRDALHRIVKSCPAEGQDVVNVKDKEK